MYRVCLHPDGLAARTRNFREWGGYLLQQLHRAVVLTNDLRADRAAGGSHAPTRTCGQSAPPRWATWDEPPLLVPVIIEVENAVLSMFTTLTTFGTPRDVTLDELAVELFFPGDDETDAILRGAP